MDFTVELVHLSIRQLVAIMVLTLVVCVKRGTTAHQVLHLCYHVLQVTTAPKLD